MVEKSSLLSNQIHSFPYFCLVFPAQAAGLLNSLVKILYVDMLPCKGTSNSPGLSEASPWVVK